MYHAIKITRCYMPPTSLKNKPDNRWTITPVIVLPESQMRGVMRNGLLADPVQPEMLFPSAYRAWFGFTQHKANFLPVSAIRAHPDRAKNA